MAYSKPAYDDPLVDKVREYVKEYMSHYDGSHDYSHIQRVVNVAQYIHSQSPPTPSLDLRVVTLAALLHDVGDKKYLKPGEDASAMVRDVLLDLGAEEILAQRIQTICLGVSYSGEIRDPEKVQGLIDVHPELAVVQDADRLDAIGAVGIGRCFTFGGAKNRPMEDSLVHFDEKLLRIQGMMKTGPGRKLAAERSERLRLFKLWWNDEVAMPRRAMSPSR